MTIYQFLQHRQMGQNQRFDYPGSKRTVLICSHIWWTEQIAYSLLKQGCNVLVATPWYGLYSNDVLWQQGGQWFDNWVKMIQDQKVDLAIGGNAAAMVLHPTTGQPLHQAAGIPLVNYWWDEPRVPPPMAQRGYDFKTYLAALKDDRTLNAIWDVDILQEMAAYFGLTNTLHLPLATTPEFWPVLDLPLARRQWAGCFLGNYHVAPRDQRGHWSPELIPWATSAANAKLADPSKPMLDCLRLADPGFAQQNDSDKEFERWGMLSVLLMDQNRNDMVMAMAKRLGDRFVLIGKNWDKLGLRPLAEHSGLPHAAQYYANSQLSLNLFGGCVHAGMPLRPFEIAASHGLIFTQFNRELPDLFDLDKECVSFDNQEQMVEKIDHILNHPSDFDGVVQAGRNRVIHDHTWDHRMATLLKACQERFDLPW